MALRCVNDSNNGRCSGTDELRATRADGDFAAFEGRELSFGGERWETIIGS
jgi:hypothetical protein